MGQPSETRLYGILQTTVQALELTSKCNRKPLECCEQGPACRVRFVKISLANTKNESWWLPVEVRATDRCGSRARRKTFMFLNHVIIIYF